MKQNINTQQPLLLIPNAHRFREAAITACSIITRLWNREMLRYFRWTCVFLVTVEPFDRPMSVSRKTINERVIIHNPERLFQVDILASNYSNISKNRVRLVRNNFSLGKVIVSFKKVLTIKINRALSGKRRISCGGDIAFILNGLLKHSFTRQENNRKNFHPCCVTSISSDAFRPAVLVIQRNRKWIGTSCVHFCEL